MDETNQSAIKAIYSNYFDVIDSFFGSIKGYLGEEKDSHIDLGVNIASYPLISDLIAGGFNSPKLASVKSIIL